MALELWTLQEFEEERDGVIDRPVGGALGAHGRASERLQALRALRILQAQGWPGAISAVEVQKISGSLFVLKCKPGCWRIYFHVIAARRLILLLDAVCKKKWKREKDAGKKASGRLERFRAGAARGFQVDL